MNTETFSFQSTDGVDIFAHTWLPGKDAPLKAILQISHGMAEHSARYERFASALCQAGIGVYANDHRGHGQTAGDLDKIGFFADANGWDKVVEDMHRLTGIIAENHPVVPIFLFGHSMGSFLSRTYITRYGNEVTGAILSGTGGDPGLLGKVGLLVARTESWIRGNTARSPMLNNLSFGGFNKAFKPNRTDFDWLSRDEAEVDKYVADPYCGGVFTAGFFVDLIGGINFINTPEAIAMVPKSLPIFLFSGALDPVGDNTKGVQQVCDGYKAAGIEEVSVKFYDGGHHEMLNETNRDEVFGDVIRWVSDRM
ncbi:MAG: lysophospholipase [Desulfobacterales bacterium]|nr:lysophospholipase [Desulfobacterales bacterium]